MSKTILGISAFYHDAAAALVRDGTIVAAAEEECFTRKKHDPRFPVNAINYCLEKGVINASELDVVIFYDNPLATFDRVVENALASGHEGRAPFQETAGQILGDKVWVNEHALRALGSLGREGQVLFAEHHMAHAASAFYPSPFERAAILTINGVGEWASTSMGAGDGKKIRLFSETSYLHSPGLLYRAFSNFCGFNVNSGEYKLMGLALLGEPRYYETIRQHLIDVRDDGSTRLDTAYFGYLSEMVMTDERFAALFDGPARQPDSPITRREMDLAASVQKVTEEIMLGTARHLRAITGEANLVMAGGVALNCMANGKLVAEKIFDKVWIQPLANDVGGSLGAALLAHHVYFDQRRAVSVNSQHARQDSYLGPAFSSNEVHAFATRDVCPHAGNVD
jgi:carbamoyltransferase